jgi:hypothetical protein
VEEQAQTDKQQPNRRLRPVAPPRLNDQQRLALSNRAMDSTSGWRNEAFDEYVRLWDELEALPTDVRNRASVDYRTAEDRLDTALIAIAPASVDDWHTIHGVTHPRWEWCREWVRTLITGTRRDAAWSALHDASEALLMLYDEPALRRQATRLERQLAHFDPADRHLKEYRALIDRLRDPKVEADEDMRAQLRDMLEAAHDMSDRFQRSMRAVRNQLVVACAAIGGLLIFAAGAHAFNTDIFSVCAGKSAQLQNDICPDGSASPDGFDVFGVQLIGALGGLLSAIVPYLTGQLVTGRYRLFLAQIWLKVQVGALSGFLGVLLLEGGLLAGLTVQQGSKIYAYAAFFGFAQQALTGFIDRRVSSIAKQGPQQQRHQPAVQSH